MCQINRQCYQHWDLTNSCKVGLAIHAHWRVCPMADINCVLTSSLPIEDESRIICLIEFSTQFWSGWFRSIQKSRALIKSGCYSIGYFP